MAKNKVKVLDDWLVIKQREIDEALAIKAKFEKKFSPFQQKAPWPKQYSSDPFPVMELNTKILS